MNDAAPARPMISTHAHYWLPYLSVAILAAIGGAAAIHFTFNSHADLPSEDGKFTQPHEQTGADSPSPRQAGESDAVSLPQSQWERSAIQLATVSQGPFQETVRLTGKVSLNEDRIAHIYPMVEGAVDRVLVGLGDVVEENQLLAVVHSREIGEAKLELYQARLHHEMAVVKDKLQQDVAANTRKLLAALRNEAPISDIESTFRNRSMGDYRERLLLAYARYLKSAADVERLKGLTETGAVSGKQLMAAKSSLNADQATFQARIEQIDYELQTTLLLSSQAVSEAATRVAVAATTLRILGCDEEDIQSIDPEKQGEAISHYSVRAPFDGTVISKDIALKEQVRPDSQIISVADLSTVWITANIYEKNVPLLSSLAGKPVQVFNEAWPDRVFEAQVFFSGEIMDESTRTVSMRAIAENDEHLLKPGMFVNICFESPSDHDLLTVATTAIQEHAGKQFVFVHKGGDEFEPRDVSTGKSNESVTVVLDGLAAGEEIVVDGGFILKSKLLEDLMEEE